MREFFKKTFVKVICWIAFVIGSLGLLFSGVDIENVNKIFTLLSGSLASVSGIILQIINFITNKQPEAKG